mgnify:CR=1 FL=1
MWAKPHSVVPIFQLNSVISPRVWGPWQKLLAIKQTISKNYNSFRILLKNSFLAFFFRSLPSISKIQERFVLKTNLTNSVTFQNYFGRLNSVFQALKLHQFPTVSYQFLGCMSSFPRWPQHVELGSIVVNNPTALWQNFYSIKRPIPPLSPTLAREGGGGKFC